MEIKQYVNLTKKNNQNYMPGLFTTPLNFNLPDTEIVLLENFFTKEMADRYYALLKTGIEWHEGYIVFYGKKVLQPRLLAWYGDERKSYTYSGQTYHPLAWNKTLLEIKQAVEDFAAYRFNSCLLNLYRNGNDSMGYHSDDEPELGQNPVIASVSFGGTRLFKLQHKKDKTLKADVDLNSGSLLIMKGPTQHYWKHAIPKTQKTVAERINLTFRRII